MGFEVYGICTWGQLYVFPRAKPEGRHATARRYKCHTPLKPMVQMTCAIVAFIVPANCFTVFRRSHSCPATLVYPRVHRCTLAWKAPPKYMGFVHYGGAFQVTYNYGTSIYISKLTFIVDIYYSTSDGRIFILCWGIVLADTGLSLDGWPLFSQFII